MRNYSAKLRHNVVYVFSIFNGDVITPNLGKYLVPSTIREISLQKANEICKSLVNYTTFLI